MHIICILQWFVFISLNVFTFLEQKLEIFMMSNLLVFSKNHDIYHI